MRTVEQLEEIEREEGLAALIKQQTEICDKVHLVVAEAMADTNAIASRGCFIGLDRREFVELIRQRVHRAVWQYEDKVTNQEEESG